MRGEICCYALDLIRVGHWQSLFLKKVHKHSAAKPEMLTAVSLFISRSEFQDHSFAGRDQGDPSSHLTLKAEGSNAARCFGSGSRGCSSASQRLLMNALWSAVRGVVKGAGWVSADRPTANSQRHCSALTRRTSASSASRQRTRSFSRRGARHCGQIS